MPYDAEVLDFLPGDGSVRTFEIPAGLSGGEMHLQIRVNPDVGEPWIGLFRCRAPAVAGVVGLEIWPRAGHLLALAKGCAYRLNVADPAQVTPLPLIPVVWMWRQNDLVILGDHTRFCGVDEDGVRWRTRRQSSHGFREARLDGNTLRAEAWTASRNEWHGFRLDISSGAVTP